MPDPAWPSSPPEVNYLRLAGTGAAGTATTLASAAAWQAVAVTDDVAFSVSSVSTAVTAADFQGVGGASSSSTAAELNGSLQLLAGWAQAKPPLLASAVSAYETALTTMIPAAVSLANRAEQAADEAMNPLVLGALTPAIVALDCEYFGEHWPHNAGAGAAYGATLTALIAALAVPPPVLPPSSAAGGPLAAAAAMAQEGAQVAAGQAMKQTASATARNAAAPVEAAATMAQPLQAAVSAAQPAVGMAQAPLQSLQGLSGLPQSMAGPLAGMFAPENSTAGLPMIGTASAPTSVGGVAGGAGAAGAGISAGGLPGGGLTSYSRPSASFPAENSGRPVGLKTGPLNAAELRGPTAVGPMPMAPASAGIPRDGKGTAKDDEVVRARVAVPPTRTDQQTPG
ncbi:MAG: PPE domain-containing protein [Mycobacterium sp.]